MTHCVNCGIEVDPEASFCSGCGAELAERETTPEDTPDNGTQECVKCDSQIPVDADRCSQCGYEPRAHGIIATILIMLGLGNVALMGLIFVVTWITVVAGSVSISGGLAASVGALLFSIPGLVILYLAALSERKTPTGTKSWRELWNDA